MAPQWQPRVIMDREDGAQSRHQVEIIFFSTPTPAATARSYSSGTVAESCKAMPVDRTA